MRMKAGIGLLTWAILFAVSPMAHATYPGTNGKITYDVISSSPPAIFEMDPDGSNQTLLIENGRYSAWSPDGRRIAYTCQILNSYNQVCTASANGTAIEPLEGGGAGEGGPYRPFWSPNAQHLIVDNLIYVGHNPSEPYTQLWRVDAADGGDPIRMAEQATSGSWSRNGYIAYTEVSPEHETSG